MKLYGTKTCGYGRAVAPSQGTEQRARLLPACTGAIKVMSMKHLHSIMAAFSFLTLSISSAEAKLRVADRLKLGGDGGWDCLTFAPKSNRLYVARGDRVLVVDTATGKLVDEIKGLDGAHGVAIVDEHNRGFASSGKTNELFVFDLKTDKIEVKLKTGENPDIVHYDEASKKVLVFNGKSKDVTVVDPASLKTSGPIALGGKPEFAAGDGKGRIFVNLEDTSETVELELREMKVTRRFSLKPCEEPTGLAFDASSSHLIAACGNKMIVVLDAKSGKVLQTLPAGEGMDGLAYDSGREMVFATAGEGELIVLKKEKSGLFKNEEKLKTMKGARTLALDEKGRRLFTPTAELGPTPAPAAPGARVRPPILPDTFVVLVVAP